MKKYIVFLIGILLLISLVGCTNDVETFIEANKVTDEAVANIDILAVSMVNSRLEMYKSSKARGREVTRLIDEVENLNTQNMTPDKIEISFLFDGTEDDIEELSKYSVDFEYNNETGYIQKVTIDKAMSDVQSGEENI